MRLPKLKDPVLVAGTDGVGTKIELARTMGRLGTIGIDLVAMSVNDVSACGAVPLFFLDYLVVGKVDSRRGRRDRRRRGRRLSAGELRAARRRDRRAPRPVPGGDFDMAGFAVGLAERDELWGPHLVAEGDVARRPVLQRPALQRVQPRASPPQAARHRRAQQVPQRRRSVLRARRPQGVCRRDPADPDHDLQPVLQDLGDAGGVHAAAHITGGGFPDNVGRAIPDGLAAEIDLGAGRPALCITWLHSLGVSPRRC